MIMSEFSEYAPWTLKGPKGKYNLLYRWVRGDFLRPPHAQHPAAVIVNNEKSLDPLRAKKTFLRKKLGQTVVSAIQALSVTL